MIDFATCFQTTHAQLKNGCTMGVCRTVSVRTHTYTQTHCAGCCDTSMNIPIGMTKRRSISVQSSQRSVFVCVRTDI